MRAASVTLKSTRSCLLTNSDTAGAPSTARIGPGGDFSPGQRLKDRLMPRFFPKSPTAILLIGAAAGAIVGACVAMAAQPNMQAALGSLQAARAELVKATPNKGGHRERAIQFVDSAIGETRAGIGYAGP
jgi:hypothetical protein